MIRLRELELLNWDLQPHQALPLSGGVNLITGENGSGKTAILDALKVGLGAARLGDDRTMEDYLLKQAAPLAMVRLVVDNAAAAGTAARPFDALGEFGADVITLAVVFEAVEEKAYSRFYYMLDGDVVPLEKQRDGSTGPALSRYRRLGVTDYRERLRRVGVTDNYRRLLCLPQGQVARLCRQDDVQLFGYLFDLIGGRHALEEWEARLADLGAAKIAHEATHRSLAAARSDLRSLEGRVRRHEEFLEARSTLSAIDHVIPHAERRETRGRLAGLQTKHEAVTLRLDEHSAALHRSSTRIHALQRELDALDARKADLGSTHAATQEEWRAVLTEQASARARFEELERKRQAASDVPVDDVERIEAELHGVRVSMARGDAAEASRAERRQAIEAELEELSQGLLPYPAAVESFRAVLRREGVAHHVLAEVVDVNDDAWCDAVEGVLDRVRLAVLVQNADDWRRAAELARRERYPYGVLVPDVRSHSSADERSIFPLLDISEPRYRPLLARLVRSIRPGKPPEPLEPTQGFELLARDGFVVSPIQAYHTSLDRTYLGRRARVRRQRTLEAERDVLDLESREHARRNDAGLAASRALEKRLAAQRLRLEWEAHRDEHGRLREAVASLAEREGRLRDRIDALLVEIRGLETTARELKQEEGKACAETQKAQATITELSAELETLACDVHATEEALGRLMANELQPLTEEEQALLEDIPALDTLRTLAHERGTQLERFTLDERDTLLPTNLERQRREVDRVESHLETLAADLSATTEAAEKARDQYRRTTQLVFRRYFARLTEAAEALDFGVEGRLEPHDDGRFRCDVRVRVGEKAAVHYNSEALSGGQKAALSILLGMTAVSNEDESAGFFLIDEPFSASDVYKINELGSFLHRTGAQYLVSMPTSADLQRCGDWLEGVWTCTRTRGGSGEDDRLRLAPPVKLSLTTGVARG